MTAVTKSESSPAPIIVCQGVGKHFGGVTALNDVDFQVTAGEVVGVIGPNGAGKTTLINAIAGTIHADSGTVRIAGRETTTMPPHRIARLGLRRTFQLECVFRELTVLENVQVGTIASRDASSSVREALQRARLDGHETELAGTLPYGLQRRLAIAIALVARPNVVLMDEPAAGLNATETLALMQVIGEMQADGVAIVLVEHDVRLVLNVASRIVVMNYGEVIAEGDPQTVVKDKLVIETYLGAMELGAS